MLFQEGIFYGRKFRLLERNRTPGTRYNVGCPCGLVAINGNCPPVLYVKANHEPPHRTRSNADCYTLRHARATVTVHVGCSVAAGCTHSAHHAGCGCYRTSIPRNLWCGPLSDTHLARHNFCTRTRIKMKLHTRAYKVIYHCTCRC